MLFPGHRQQLVEESGIAEPIIDARGYRSLTRQAAPAVLKELGFNPTQCRLGAGLLIPVLGIDGTPVLHQFRPDHPRQNHRGKAIKYESPSKASTRLDMGVDQREWLQNPAIPLCITEGVKKADAGRSKGLCVVALLGVWNWRGRNHYGGLTTLGEWEEIALKGRTIYLVFDNDVMRKHEVRVALKRLKAWLETKGSKVRVIYLPESDGRKVGLDDYLREHTAAELIALAGQAPPAEIPHITLLDAAPPMIRRPLSLIDGQAYAVSWLPYQEHIDAEEVKGRVIPAHTISRKALVVMRQDGTWFSERLPGMESLHRLGIEVRLPDPPKDDRLWSTQGMKAYRRGERPQPTEVFQRLVRINDHFLDFYRSLADQRTMCEMLACHELATWFLDAFDVIGYVWPNGETGTGKTTLLNVVAETAYLGEVILASSTMAVLRDLADYGATLCFDEAERLDSKQADPEKLALLLSGNRRGSSMSVKEQGPDKGGSGTGRRADDQGAVRCVASAHPGRGSASRAGAGRSGRPLA
jgi:Domain of unknown function (DUF3854)